MVIKCYSLQKDTTCGEQVDSNYDLNVYYWIVNQVNSLFYSVYSYIFLGRPVLHWERFFGSPGSNETWTGMVGLVHTQVKPFSECLIKKFLGGTFFSN